jgi:type I restriction enzyme S subunit
MIADLRPYAEYKESGLPWLGTVPEHWELIPNRGLVRRRKVLVGNRHSDYQLLSLTKQGVIVKDSLKMGYRLSGLDSEIQFSPAELGI